MEIVIAVVVLLSALIYLHIVQNSLISQDRIKYVIYFLLGAFTITGISSLAPVLTEKIGILKLVSVCRAVSWGFIIAAYWCFFDVCYKAAFFQRTDSVDQVLRAKVFEIISDACEKKELTGEFKMFLQVKHGDPVVESVRSNCDIVAGGSHINYLSDKDWGKMETLAEKLKRNF